MYYLNLGITNRAGGPIRIVPSDKIPKEGLPVGTNLIAQVRKKVKSPMPITLTAVDANSNKELYINYMRSFTMTPTENNAAFVPITITKTRKYNNNTIMIMLIILIIIVILIIIIIII